ncbi:MAG: hypothetical protein FP814_09770 [Desulfobacterium sp.]|nr:hypothetical protein [Desulfobacteraceae bacterium]MBA3036768.1 hypothetical protein [Desulfobacterium sp.]
MIKNFKSQISNVKPGFSDWVEIFSGGLQTDSHGMEHDGDALIDAAVAKFDPSYHEPPAVLGHPKDDAPAFGWVESVKVETVEGVKRLYAKFKQVVPEFEEMVKNGLYKKRSASFYPDGRLRHVGWLGAMPPAVKGLADVAFSNGEDAVIFDFLTEEVSMKFQDFMEAFKFWKKIQDDPDTDLGDPMFGKQKPASGAASFTEADLEAAKAEAARTAKEEAKAEAAASFAEAEKSRKKASAKTRIDGLIATGIQQGSLAPAWKDAGIAEFMAGLDCEAVVSFAEGSEKKTGLDWFCDFLGTLPKLVNFSEVATRETDMKTGAAADKLTALVNARLKEDKTLTYGAAFAEVQKQHPELAAEYRREFSTAH